MAPGDVVLIYNSGRIRFAGEIAAKVRNRELARYFRFVIDLLQVFDLLGRQKSPDFLQSSFALDGVFEMSLRGGIPSGDDEEDLS